MSEISGRVWGVNRKMNRIVVDVGRGLVVLIVLGSPCDYGWRGSTGAREGNRV